METILIRRRLSAIEIAGRWFALAVGIAALTALTSVRVDHLLAVPPDAAEWSDAYDLWLLEFFGTAPVVLVLALVPRWLPASRRLRWPLLVLVIACAAWLGWLGQLASLPLCGCDAPTAGEGIAMQHWLVVLGTLIAIVGEYRLGSRRAADALHRTELDRLQLQSELAAGRLQLLQAQIEPHFLFNSLANVRRLLRTDGSSGNRGNALSR